jgi:hypothetical protein
MPSDRSHSGSTTVDSPSQEPPSGGPTAVDGQHRAVNEGGVLADEVGHDLGDLVGLSQDRHRPAATAMLPAVHGGLQLAQVLRGTTPLEPAVDAMINHKWFSPPRRSPLAVRAPKASRPVAGSGAT